MRKLFALVVVLPLASACSREPQAPAPASPAGVSGQRADCVKPDEARAMLYRVFIGSQFFPLMGCPDSPECDKYKKVAHERVPSELSARFEEAKPLLRPRGALYSEHYHGRAWSMVEEYLKPGYDLSELASLCERVEGGGVEGAERRAAYFPILMAKPDGKPHRIVVSETIRRDPDGSWAEGKVKIEDGHGSSSMFESDERKVERILAGKPFPGAASNP